MGLTYQDVLPRLEAQAAKRRIDRAEQAKMAQGVGQVMAELLTDPRWNLYNQHLAAVLETDRKRLTALRDKLSGMTFLSEQDTGQARVDAAYAKGHRDALEWAMKLVKELVERGEVAKENLQGGDAGAGPSGT